MLPDQRFAVLGGCNENNAPLSSCEAYDAASNTWQPLPPMLEPRYGCAAWAVGGCVLVAGGGGQDSAEVLDVAEGVWRRVPGAQLPRAISSPGYALVARQ